MLDTSCPACQSSRAFYRALDRAAAEVVGTGFVVIVEESVHEARSWLAADGIGADQIIRIRSRAQAGFIATPTLMLVDESGVISDIANHALSLADEQQFMERLRRPGAGPPLRIGHFIREVEVGAEPASAIDPTIQLIDTRDRTAFRREHSASAMNIPRDELEVRAPAELLRTRPVYVDCRHDEQQLCRIAGATLQEAMFEEVRVLLR